MTAPPSRVVVDRFRRNLRNCRRAADLSQEQVALLASLHRTEIGKLEKGERIPRIDTLLKLMGALEVSASELLDGIEWLPDWRHRPGTFRVGLPARRQAGGAGRG